VKSIARNLLAIEPTIKYRVDT